MCLALVQCGVAATPAWAQKAPPTKAQQQGDTTKVSINRYKSLYEGPGAIDESDGHTNVFPIPADVRALNSNLTQNPGY